MITPEQALKVWEMGESQSWPDKALALLRVAYPNRLDEHLLNLTVGQRNASLAVVRERVFGSIARCYCRCMHCNQEMEFSCRPTLLMHSSNPPAEGHECQIGDNKVQYRLPTLGDLCHIARYSDQETARRVLIKRCVPKGDSEVLEQWQSKVAEKMQACDPNADVRIDVECHSCNQKHHYAFSVLGFFWQELTRYVKQLFREIDALAKAYGWDEQAILAMTETRRQVYLELIMQ